MDGIRIYMLRSSAAGVDQCEALYPLVEPQRAAFLRRCRDPVRRGASLAAGLVLRELFPQWHREIRTGPHGKPELPPTSGMQFSLTYAGSLVLLAVSRRPVGLDAVREDAADPRMVREFLSAREQAWVQSHPPGGRMRAFCRVWAGKESFVKYRGTGLPPGSVTVPVERFWNEPVRDSDKDCWFFGFSPEPSIQAALCCAHRPGNIALRNLHIAGGEVVDRGGNTLYGTRVSAPVQRSV